MFLRFKTFFEKRTKATRVKIKMTIIKQLNTHKVNKKYKNVVWHIMSFPNRIQTLIQNKIEIGNSVSS